MYLLVLYASFISFVVSILYGKSIGTYGSAVVSVFALLVCNFSSIYLFYEVCCLHTPCYLDLAYWLNLDFMSIHYGFLYDSLTVTMLFVITSISLFAHIYSVDYMGSDAHFVRFISYLSLFTFCMLLLVTAGNLLQLFIGWEGVGICSYLLINFWFTRIQANKSALKAMLVNKISDLSLLLGIALVFWLFMSVDFNIILSPILFSCANNIMFFGFDLKVLQLICVLILIGAMGKSAQFGLHIWLPDAMEGPTPVSSLIHAATMVTAGVFLIVRVSPFFEIASNISLLIIFVGSVTIFFSSTVGIFQNDIKKVIAYSTCSQIGYMIFICGYAGYSIAMFHLFNHAFFKALLFLAAGSIIHANTSEQDLRRMGGLFKLIPVSYVSFLVGSVSLMGLPFLTGFYSKDLIAEIAYLFSREFCMVSDHSIFFVTALYWLAVTSIVLTSVYSVRLFSCIFLYEYNGFMSFVRYIHDLPIFMNLALSILVFLSIFVGFFAYDMMVGMGTDFWQNSLFVCYSYDYEYIMNYTKCLPVLYSVYGMVLCLLAYNVVPIYKCLYAFQTYYFLYNGMYFFNKKWYIDKIYNDYLVGFAFTVLSYSILFRLFDKGVIELFGPLGLSRFSTGSSLLISKLQTGFVYHYAGILLNIILLLLVVPIFELALFDSSFMFFYI